VTTALARRTCGNDAIRLVRDAYLGRTLREADYWPLDESLARRIALAYEAMPVTPASDRDLQEAHRAYSALVGEVDRQFEATLESDFVVRFTDDDPYPNSTAMMADLKENRRLLVYRTSPDHRHPFLTAEQNDRLRAVHDFYGHGAEGFQFGPRGEDNAWREHARIFSAAAIPALASETRGQNSWVNVFPGHELLPVRERPYATQKFGLLPEWGW